MSVLQQADRMKPTPTRMRIDVGSYAPSLGSIRLPEFILFFLLEGIGFFRLPSIGIPQRHLVLAAIIALALTRSPRYDLGRYGKWVLISAAGLVYLGFLSYLSPIDPLAADWRERLVRMCAVTVFVFVIGSGRLDLRSGVIGYFSALVLNVPAFYMGLVPAPYGEYLTGIIGDKNVAGLVYATTGVLILLVTTSRWVQAATVLFTSYALWETGSRTSLAAFAAALAWIFVAPKLPLAGRWLWAVLNIYVISLVAEDYSQIGVFSGREGSDRLRARIDAASELKVEDAGLFGKGLGEAFVYIADDGRTWLFHNSFWTALVEGGWPWTVIVVSMTVFILMLPFTANPPREQYLAQALGVVMLLCAWRLGEVFCTTTWGIAMGAGILTLVRGMERAGPRSVDGTARTRSGVSS